jgi:hypothetical protein
MSVSCDGNAVRKLQQTIDADRSLVQHLHQGKTAVSWGYFQIHFT